MAFKRSSVRFRLAPPNSLSLILGCATLALVACQSAPEAPPPPPPPKPAFAAAPPSLDSAVLDQSVAITPPGKGVPARYAKFSGIWAGRLDGQYEGKLAVLTVSQGGQVTVSYAWGDVADNKPGVADGAGRIVGNRLKLGRLPNGADATFTMLPDGTLDVTYTLGDQTYRGPFARVGQ